MTLLTLLSSSGLRIDVNAGEAQAEAGAASALISFSSTGDASAAAAGPGLVAVLSPASADALATSATVEALEGFVFSPASGAADCGTTTQGIAVSFPMENLPASAGATPVAPVIGAFVNPSAAAATASGVSTTAGPSYSTQSAQAVAEWTTAGITAKMNVVAAVATAAGVSTEAGPSYRTSAGAAIAEMFYPFPAWDMVSAYTQALRALVLARIPVEASLISAGALASLIDTTTYAAVDEAAARMSALAESESEISLALALATEYRDL